jgi:polysaccharide export outer membrane protein
MTPAVLEAEIARRLREQELVKDPQVTVRVADYRGQTIYVLGEVMQPGQYYMRQGMHLSDLLGLTIGFPTEGKMYLYRRAQLERAAGEDTVTDEGLAGETVVAEALEIDLNELADGTSPDMSIPLQGGDMLYVPFNKPNFFFITGEIGRPGAIEIPPSRKLLVSQAIAFAGGPSRTAKMSEGILLRYDEAGVRQELAVDFSAILRGKEPDFEILPNDIIFIPGSNAKTLGYGLLGIIPGLATRAVIP